METFLQNTARYLYDKYGDGLSDCALVFPNRRAGLFFTRYLSSMINRPVWLPGMFTIADLLEDVSTLKTSDPIALNFELYRVFKSVTKSSESFDEFYSWGEILLGDFDEIDKYMVDAAALFRNVSELRELDDQFDYLTREQIETIRGFWSTFRPGTPSSHQKEFLRLWEALAPIYASYRKHLLEKDLAYEGMIFSHAAGKVLDGTARLPDHDKFFIAGFNALNKCEKVFFDFLQKEGRAEFFWDYDQYYTSDPSHQAGTFMRENLRHYPHTGFEQESRNIEERDRDIQIIAVPSNSGQPKILSALSDMFSGGDPLKTAVVLPDEGLLLPVLSSLPGEIGEINVTMGYPLKDTPVYGFVMHLLSLHKNSRTSRGEVVFYYKDVLALLQHPDYAERDEGMTAGIIRKMKESNQVYISGSGLAGSEFGRLVFQRAPAGIGFTGYLIDVLMYVVKHRYDGPAEDKEDDSKTVSFPAREFIYRVYTGIGRLRDILEESQTTIRFDTLVKLIKKVLSGIRVPFYGEPLGGVQVMGVLETRTLDFDNVIWMSVNEGSFPARQSGSSFIPYTLRKGYGLPGYEQQDAVYAYYFYRMLQRTRRMTLVYNTKSDGLFTGEPSRFIYQLKYSNKFNVRERSLVFNLLQPEDKPVHIEKTADILGRLREYTDAIPGRKYLSAAAINAYIDCSLKFYFRYIARLPEPDSITEEIDMAVFGNLFHRAAHLLYYPFTGKYMQAADIDALLDNGEGLERIVREAFVEVLGDGGGAVEVGYGGTGEIGGDAGYDVGAVGGDGAGGVEGGVGKEDPETGRFAAGEDGKPDEDVGIGSDVDSGWTITGKDDKIEGDAHRAVAESKDEAGYSKANHETAIDKDGADRTKGVGAGAGLSGINMIISSVLVTYLRQLLKVDRKLVPFRVEALEKDYFGKIAAGPEGERFNVKTGGIIDRVDQVSGMTRVVDYKTGKDDAEFRTVESLFERGNPKRRKAVFQTFLYAWLYLQDSKTHFPVSPFLYQVRKFFGDESLVVSQRQGGSNVQPVWDFNEHRAEFEAGLQSVLSELFDPKTGFSQADNADICRFCPYGKLCHRSK